VVQERFSALDRLAEVDAAKLSGPLVHVAEELTVDVL